MLLVILAVGVGWIRRKSCSDGAAGEPLVRFSLLYLFVFAMFMSTQCNLVWNVRYFIPACPLLYVILAAGLPRIPSFTNQPLQNRAPDHFAYVLVAVMALECAFNFPHYFSYINPFLGGSHRVPIALNDSNVDYGQDLFTIRKWVREQTQRSDQPSNLKAFGVLSGHGRLWLSDIVEPATDKIVQRALRHKELVNLGGSQSRDIQSDSDVSSREVLIVSRGLTHPEPWAVRYSLFQYEATSSETGELVRKLLLHTPDITSVVAVYFLPVGD